MRFVRDAFQELERSFSGATQEGGKGKFHRLRLGQGIAPRNHVIENRAKRFPGILERINFGKIFVEFDIQESLEAERRFAGLQKPLLEFFEQAFYAQVVERKRAAKFYRRGRKRATETAGKLHPAQNTQGIFGKGRAHMTQRMRLQVINTAVRVA